MSDLSNPFDPEFGSAPLVLEWELGVGANLSNHSTCDYASSTRYCARAFGYNGNPYLVEGCIYQENAYGDVDHSPEGLFRKIFGGAFIFVGSMIGLQILVVAAWKFGEAIIEAIEAIKASRKHMFFKRNGGILMEQQLATIENGIEKIRLFSSVELAKATDVMRTE